MKNLLSATAIALALGIASPAAAQPVEIPTWNQDMAIGQAVMFRSPDTFKNVSVALPEVADIVIASDRRVLVEAKMKGATAITLMNEAGMPVHTINIRVVEIPEMYGRKRITVHYGTGGDGKPPKKDQVFWCDKPTGCLPDPGNAVSEITLNSTTILPDGTVIKGETTSTRPDRRR